MKEDERQSSRKGGSVRFAHSVVHTRGKGCTMENRRGNGLSNVPTRQKQKSGGLLAKLNAAAPVKPVNNIIPLGTYYRSAALLQRQADEYRRLGNREQLYVMLLRYAR